MEIILYVFWGQVIKRYSLRGEPGQPRWSEDTQAAYEGASMRRNWGLLAFCSPSLTPTSSINLQTCGWAALEADAPAPSKASDVCNPGWNLGCNLVRPWARTAQLGPLLNSWLTESEITNVYCCFKSLSCKAFITQQQIRNIAIISNGMRKNKIMESFVDVIWSGKGIDKTMKIT